MMLLKDKVAVVTGANRGIGSAIAKCFAQNGAHVIATARTAGSLDDMCSNMEKSTPLYFDVSDFAAVKNAFKEILKVTKYIDVLVNNAGIMDNSLLTMISSENIQKTFTTNTFGTLYMMHLGARIMMKKKSGSIINISSILGVNGAEGTVVYSGSKAAIIGITKAAAKELAPSNIRVNAIAPGFIETDLVKALPEDKYKEKVDTIKMNRVGTVTDVANCALFLASELSTYVTGQVIGVDGAMIV